MDHDDDDLDHRRQIWRPLETIHMSKSLLSHCHPSLPFDASIPRFFPLPPSNSCVRLLDRLSVGLDRHKPPPKE